MLVEIAGNVISVVVSFVLTVGEDRSVVSPSVTDAVFVEGNVDELDAVVAAVVDVPVVLPTNIIQPSCHNKQKQRKSHKKSSLTCAQYINNVDKHQQLRLHLLNRKHN